MLHDENEDLQLIIKSYVNLGFSVKVDGDFLIVEKQGQQPQKISIDFAMDFLNSIVIENY